MRSLIYAYKFRIADNLIAASMFVRCMYWFGSVRWRVHTECHPKLGGRSMVLRILLGQSIALDLRASPPCGRRAKRVSRILASTSPTLHPVVTARCPISVALRLWAMVCESTTFFSACLFLSADSANGEAIFANWSGFTSQGKSVPKMLDVALPTELCVEGWCACFNHMKPVSMSFLLNLMLYLCCRPGCSLMSRFLCAVNSSRFMQSCIFYCPDWFTFEYGLSYWTWRYCRYAFCRLFPTGIGCYYLINS